MAKQIMNRALLFNPYLDTLGGGERYFLTFALALLQYGFEVDIAWKDDDIQAKAQERFGLDFRQLHLNPSAYKSCISHSGLWERFWLTSQYQLVFWVSDGTIPLLFSANNLVHFQVPFTRLGGHRLLNTFKSLFVHQFVYNSQFTQKTVEKSNPNAKGTVLYPPIDTLQFRSGKKENLILAVGRFDSPSHAKRQDILIRAFKELHQEVKNYKLVIIGGLKGKKSVIDPLYQLSRGLPVEIIVNPRFPVLQKYFSQAKIFWHAAGYQVDDQIHPEVVEHFGMTTVEAMSAGAVPVVINRGGQKEVISQGTGFLVEDIAGFVSKTKELIKDRELLESYSKMAIKKSAQFSLKSFQQKISSLI